MDPRRLIRSSKRVQGRHIDDYYIYSERQWKWLGERYVEGYSLREIERFTGLSRRAVVNNIRKLGFRVESETYDELENRRDEFDHLR